MSKLTPTEIFIHIAIAVKDPAFWALHDLCITLSAPRGNAVPDALRPLLSTRNVTKCMPAWRIGTSFNHNYSGTQEPTPCAALFLPAAC
ncbi:hypothetical protein ALP69_102174 [Pseudomonas syringae pv. aceris]|nr:hypothetical protein ALP69_102174 [Pseudomonas syringae pv. aceris]